MDEKSIIPPPPPPPMFPAKSGLKIRKTPKGNIYEKYFRNNKD